MLRFFAALAALALTACGSGEISVARTFHSLPGDYTEVHASVRVEQKGMMAAAYRNSEGRLAVAAGAVWRAEPVFCEAGLATGYSAAGVVPMGRCGVEIGPVRAFAFPEYKIDHGASVGFGVETRLMRF